MARVREHMVGRLIAGASGPAGALVAMQNNIASIAVPTRFTRMINDLSPAGVLSIDFWRGCVVGVASVGVGGAKVTKCSFVCDVVYMRDHLPVAALSRFRKSHHSPTHPPKGKTASLTSLAS